MHALNFLSIGHHNLIQVFISYFQYLIHDNDPVGDDWVKGTNDDFNEFLNTGHIYFRRFRMDGLLNQRPTSTTLSSKLYSSFKKFEKSIKSDPNFFPSSKH